MGECGRDNLGNTAGVQIILGFSFYVLKISFYVIYIYELQEFYHFMVVCFFIDTYS